MNAERRTPNAERRTPNAERRTPNAERRTRHSVAAPPLDPHSGRRRARLSLLLPALALVVGALSPFAATPAQAQAVWSATLTPSDVGQGSVLGCDDGQAGTNDNVVCKPSGALTDNDFTVGGTDYDVRQILLGPNGTFLGIYIDPAPEAALKALNFCVGSRSFAFSSAEYVDNGHTARWTFSPALSWTAGTGVSLKIGRGSSCTEAPTQARPALTDLTVTAGGNAVTISCNNADRLGCRATVPRDTTSVTVMPTWSGTASTATVSSRELVHSGNELTAARSVTSGGSVDVALASGLAYNSAGTEHRTMVKIDLIGRGGRNNHYGLIVYKGGPTSVSLSVSPASVTEGDEATVTATLSWPWDGDRDVVFPLTGTHGTSEAGDWVFANPNVMIRRGQSTGTTRIFVGHDADSDNETMTVGLGTLPTGARQYATNTQLTAGTPSSVELTITDDEGTRGQGGDGSSAGNGASGDGVSGSSGSAGELGAVAAPGHAALITQMRTWRNDPQWNWLKEHTDRWDRALLAFGETVTDGTLTAMTAAEAQAFADRGWERWVGVAEALRQLEGGGVQAAQEDPPPQPAQDPPAALHATLIGQMNDWREDPQWRMYHSHTSRWDRALLAFGEPVADTSLTPMTDSEAQGWADSGLSRWVPVAEALKAVVTGSGSPDTLTGTGGGELLVGLGGADDLSAQGGNDELRGGNGNDDLTGGAGQDRFVFFSGETGANAVIDFASGDVIVLKGSGWSSVADIIASVTGASNGVGYVYTLASGLTVETTNNTPLRTEDFVLEE